jgi:signal transduction histidine kinase
MNGVFESRPRIARRAANAPRRLRDRDEMGKLAAAFDGLAETLREKNDEPHNNGQSLQRPEEWLPVLSRFCRELPMRRNVPSIQDLLIETVEQVFPACAVAVCIESQGGCVETDGCRNLNEESTQPAAGSEVEKCRKSAEPIDLIIVPKPQSGFRRSEAEKLRKQGRVACAKIPLVARGETLGTLSLFGKETRDLTGLEFDFLTLLADQTAVAMHHARLYKETEDQAIQLREAKKALASIQVSKSEFLSVMSHEFRTPLNLIMGYTEIMQEELTENITAEQSSYLKRIMKASEDILALVMSVLHVGSIETGCVELTRGEVGLSTLLGELQSDLALPHEKELDFVWDVPADLPIIRTDAEKLKHVLHKLIDNAVKFTKRGQVRVSSRSFSRFGKVEITISDTGIGIPNDALPGVFEKYQQLDSSIARMYDGMGVGLFIAKTFTEMLGGELKVASEPGKGSTFTVALPTVI